MLLIDISGNSTHFCVKKKKKCKIKVTDLKSLQASRYAQNKFP